MGVKLLVEEVCEGSVVSLLVLLLVSSSIHASQSPSVIGRLLATLIISGCVLGEEDSEGPVVSLPVFWACFATHAAWAALWLLKCS